MREIIVEESAPREWSVYDTSAPRALDEWIATFRKREDAEQWAEIERTASK